ncbi:hypothetical protein ACLB2K_022408 [Fragaria x ananassa]
MLNDIVNDKLIARELRRCRVLLAARYGVFSRLVVCRFLRYKLLFLEKKCLKVVCVTGVNFWILLGISTLKRFCEQCLRFRKAQASATERHSFSFQRCLLSTLSSIESQTTWIKELTPSKLICPRHLGAQFTHKKKSKEERSLRKEFSVKVHGIITTIRS